MFYKDKKVLVTGGTGFVGRHIVQALLREGAAVRVSLHDRPLEVQNSRIETVFADLTRRQDCRLAVKGVDYCFHAAGSVGGAGTPFEAAMELISTNVTMTVSLVEAAWKEGVKRLLLFSSSTVYPKIDHAVREDEAWSGPVFEGYLGYGWMRRYFEKLAEFVSARSKTKIALVRPSAVYGPGDNFDPLTSHVVAALIRRAVAKEDPFVVWGTGKEVRDFLHVGDLARGSLLMLERYAVCDPVNIGYGRGIQLCELVDAVLRAAGYEKAKVVFDPSQPSLLPFRAVDTSKARTVLGFEPAISLREGLEETVRWYREAYRPMPSGDAG